MGELDGLGAVVTGGASGIGAATVRRLAGDGARVAVLDRDGGGAQQVAAEVDGAIALSADVRDPDALRRAVDEAAATFGGLAILVNNAGTGDLRPLHTLDDRLWQRLLDVNLAGTFYACRAAIPHLQAHGGTIVNNASVSGITPTRNEAAYSAAKAGVIALTKSVALEYGPEVRANCVAPGFVRTPLTAIWDEHPDAFAPVAATIPLRRMGTAAEVADVIAFLCSPRSAYVTGHTIVVDGGLSLPQAGTDEALARLFDDLAGGD